METTEQEARRLTQYGVTAPELQREITEYRTSLQNAVATEATRSTPALAGALAKAAVGATERLPHARVTNLSRALERLADLGWRAVGLDGSADQTLEEALDAQPTVLVMGSEGDGIRRLVAEHCDVLAKIPMPGGFESLNVSNAAAVALYEAARAQRG